MTIAIGLLKVLLDLDQLDKTAAVDVLGPASRVRVFVESGRVVYAERGTDDDSLGQLLLRERVLTDEQYAAAIEWSLSQKEPAELGDVLVELRLLTRGQLHAARAAQVQALVVRALSWSDARVEVVEAEPPLDVLGRFVTPLEPLVVAALRGVERTKLRAILAQTWDRLVSLRGGEAGREETRPNAKQGARNIGSSAAAARREALARVSALCLRGGEELFARGLDGTRTVGALIDEADAAEPAAPHRVDQIDVVLAALLLTDALDLREAPGSRRPSRGSMPAITPARSSSSRLAATLASIDSASSRPDTRVSGRSDDAVPPAPLTPRRLELLLQEARNDEERTTARDAPPSARPPAPIPAPVLAEARDSDASSDTSASDAAPPPAEQTIAEASDSDAPPPPAKQTIAETSDEDIRSDTSASDAALDEAKGARDRLRVGFAAAAAILLGAATFATSTRGSREQTSVADPPTAQTNPAHTDDERPALRAEIAAALEPETTSAMTSVVDAAVALPDAASSSPQTERSSPLDDAPRSAASETTRDGGAGLEPPLVETKAPARPAPVPDAQRGLLELPPAADTHRVYVDGKLVGTAPAPILVPCGRRDVKVGSRGREQNVLVPCGGRVPVAYP